MAQIHIRNVAVQNIQLGISARLLIIAQRPTFVTPFLANQMPGFHSKK